MPDIWKKLEKIVRETEQRRDFYQICKFFPSLSDSSYLASDDTEESIALLRAIFRRWNAASAAAGKICGWG